ncbi:MAG: heavy metal-binding domain-containing protein [Desulfobacterales bacterium]
MRDEPEGHAPRKEVHVYTCPLHPEVNQAGPGRCPKYGMALEPKGEAGKEEENPELADMHRRFWISLVLTLPVFILAMSDMIPGNLPAGIVSQNLLVWIKLMLATPVVFWVGWPFLVRGWQSVVSWNLDRK